MDTSKLSFPILVGTHRKDNFSSKVGSYIYKKAQQQETIHSEIFFASDIVLPQDDYGQAINDIVPEYKKAIIESDGIIIVTPEYNHGYPGTLKSILDLFLKEYIHKVAGIVGVSSGGFGGSRAIENLLPVIRELGLVVTFSDVNISHVEDHFGGDEPKDMEKIDRSIQKFFDELVWMGKTLRWGRKELQ